MKQSSTWSHSPYRPLFFEVGEVYVNRISPTLHGATVSWNDVEGECEIYLAKWKSLNFKLVAKTSDCSYTFENLEFERDYWFYVKCGDKKSRTRIFRTGNYEGTVVNYLHPDDHAYLYSGRFPCSPCLLKMPDGSLLASHDVYGPEEWQTISLIFRSRDDGKTWEYVNELFPAFWTRLFLHEGALYAIACSTEYGDVLLGRSLDGGNTFSAPVTIMHGGNGRKGEAGFHKNPQPLVVHDGRIWCTIEHGSWHLGYHAAMVMSASVDSDLLDPSSWSFSEPVKYNPEWNGVPKGPSTGTIEGTLAVRDGKLYNLMRYDMGKLEIKFGKAIRFRVNTANPEAPLEFDKCFDFPANASKFTVLYDEISKNYYSIGCNLLEHGLDPKVGGVMPRNHLCLFRSADLDRWEKACDLIDYRNFDPAWYGFQYADFIIDGDDIIYLVRTATNGAFSFHDSNCIIFKRLENFRKL